MFGDVIEIILGDAIVGILGPALATIVSIEGSPEHVPLLFRVLSALLSELYINFVYSVAENFELVKVNSFTAVCDLVPCVVYFLLMGFSFFSAALVFRFAHLTHELIMSLLLRIGETLLPFPHVVLQCCEELFLALDLLF